MPRCGFTSGTCRGCWDNSLGWECSPNFPGRGRLRESRSPASAWNLAGVACYAVEAASRCREFLYANQHRSQPTSAVASWKEIANYLGKGVRTAQRWERDLGLPVLRPIGKPSGFVSASPAELDRWRVRHWSPSQDGSHGKKGNGGLSLVPHESVNVAWESIRASRELRSQSQQLVQQLAQSTQNLTQECLRLTLRLKEVA